MKAMKKKSVYKYFNPNPSKKEVGDCVVRAFCVTTDTPWMPIYDELCSIGRELCAMPNDKSSYQEFLKCHEFTYVPISNKKGTKRPTVESFTKEHKTGKYVLVVANHLVGVADGYYYDLWESGEKSLYGYWVAP